MFNVLYKPGGRFAKSEKATKVRLFLISGKTTWDLKSFVLQKKNCYRVAFWEKQHYFLNFESHIDK